jgi:hypothetical protein
MVGTIGVCWSCNTVPWICVTSLRGMCNAAAACGVLWTGSRAAGAMFGCAGAARGDIDRVRKAERTCTL